MENKELVSIINKVFDEIEELIPLYMKNPEDKRIANGNVAVCIIDDKGQVHGKMFGLHRLPMDIYKQLVRMKRVENNIYIILIGQKSVRKINFPK